MSNDTPGGSHLNPTFDRNYVREKYMKTYAGQNYVFYPATNPKRMCIYFSSMNIDRFDRYSWFWEDSEDWGETAHLFLQDNNLTYFLGTEEKPMLGTYKKIIDLCLAESKLKYKHSYSIGSSMGGYGALYYGIMLNFKGCIVSGSQTNFKSAARHEFSNWTKNMKSCGSNFIDIDDLLHKKDRVPCIHIEFSEYAADKDAAIKVITSALEKKSFIIVNKNDGKGHKDIKMSKESIEKTISLFEEIDH
jgi:hypothetical protein